MLPKITQGNLENDELHHFSNTKASDNIILKKIGRSNATKNFALHMDNKTKSIKSPIKPSQILSPIQSPPSSSKYGLTLTKEIMNQSVRKSSIKRSEATRKIMNSPKRRSASISAIISHGSEKISSPLLRKKIDEVNANARAQRHTPELPILENLVLSASEEDPNEICYGLQKDNENFARMTRSPSLRRMRVRTLEQKHGNDIATTERMKRNTDSMLEDAVIAKKLKRRLTSRWQEITKRTITDTGLSDFIMQSIMEGSLDAEAAAKPTCEKRAHAANLAINASMQGYFVNLENKETSDHVTQLFRESLYREEFSQGEFICHQDDVADKFYVIEEGTVQFTIGELVAGTACTGSIIGEISLVYGVPHQADVQVITQCAIVWSMDTLAFRQIQAVAAKESLKSSNVKDSRSNMLKNLRRQVSNLTDEQECSQWKASPVHFKKLKRTSIIGKGTFGSVYVAVLKDKERNLERYYGLKCMLKSSIVKRKNEKRVLIEKNILQALNSPFIISLLGTHQDDHYIYLLTEFVQGGNLMTYMIEKDILSHSEAMFFCSNLVSALVHVHRKGFVHRDIKPENCLIAKDGYLKLCDFGMAKRLPATVLLPNGNTEVVTSAFTMCGTPEFMAPEFVLSTGYDKRVDLWAVGCILSEMYTGRGTFEFDGDLKKTFKEVCLIGMGRKQFQLPEQLHIPGMEVTASFAQELLTAASIRLGKKDTAELQDHKYFSSVDFDELFQKKITAPYIPPISSESDTSHFKKDVENHVSEESIEAFEGDDSWCRDF